MRSWRVRVGAGLGLAFAAAVAFGGVGIFAKLAFAAGWDLPALLATRFLVAAIVVAPFALRGGEGWRGLGAALALGAFGYVAMTALYFSSFQTVPAAAATFMLYLAPVPVAIHAWRFGGGMRGPWLAGLAASVVGLALMFGGAFAGDWSPWGLLLAGASAMVYAALIVVGKRVLRTLPPARGVLGVCAGACVGYSAWALAEGTLFSPRTLEAWGLVLGLGVVSTALALLLFYAALARAPAAQVAIVSTVEPLATLAFAFVVLGESLPAVALAGGAFILAGATLVAIEPRAAVVAEAASAEDGGA